MKKEPLKAVRGFSYDFQSYVSSLKRLKYLYGQPIKVAQAHLAKIMKGKQTADDDETKLSEFFFSISDCLSALEKMNYQTELYSVSVLQQVLKRLPQRLQYKQNFPFLYKEQKNLPFIT